MLSNLSAVVNPLWSFDATNQQRSEDDDNLTCNPQSHDCLLCRLENFELLFGCDDFVERHRGSISVRSRSRTRSMAAMSSMSDLQFVRSISSARSKSPATSMMVCFSSSSMWYVASRSSYMLCSGSCISCAHNASSSIMLHSPSCDGRPW